VKPTTKPVHDQENVPQSAASAQTCKQSPEKPRPVTQPLVTEPIPTPAPVIIVQQPQSAPLEATVASSEVPSKPANAQETGNAPQPTGNLLSIELYCFMSLFFSLLLVLLVLLLVILFLSIFSDC
jgi:hypothetical protein